MVLIIMLVGGFSAAAAIALLLTVEKWLLPALESTGQIDDVDRLRKVVGRFHHVGGKLGEGEKREKGITALLDNLFHPLPDGFRVLVAVGDGGFAEEYQDIVFLVLFEDEDETAA